MITKKNKKTALKNSLKIIVLFSLFPIILFCITSVIVYYQQKNIIFLAANEHIHKSLNNLITSVKFDELRLKEKNKIAQNTFTHYIHSNKNLFTFSTEQIQVQVINAETNTEQIVSIKNWQYLNEPLVQNPDFLQPLSLSLKNDLVIAQKTDDGYVIINSSNQNLLMYLFPYSSFFSYTIENGETYRGLLTINKTEYIISGTPLYINGRIEGILLSLQKNKLSYQLTETFENTIYFKHGYPLVINNDGTLLIHPTIKNKSISGTKVFSEILTTQSSNDAKKIEYVWPENDKGVKKTMYIKYIPSLKIYVAITYFKNNFDDKLSNIKIFLLLLIIMATATLILVILSLSKYYKIKIAQIDQILETLSTGVFPSVNDQTAASSTTKLLQNFQQLKDFSSHLAKKDYSYDYIPWGKKDTIGENLMQLNLFLRNTAKSSEEKAAEQEKLIWLNEGIAKFIEILKYQVIEIKELGYNIISQIVEYIGANEGGFFILQEEKDDKYLELLAAYSMQKEKLINRRIELGVGFVGRVALERKTLFITDIPKSYTKISTALGQATPKSIVVLPLNFNDEIIGIIELASYEIMSKLHLEFLERISENISANLAMWRASQQTSKLLQETQEQTKIQKEQQLTLKQHLDELEQLREESEQREIELNSIIKAVDTTALLVEYDKEGKITDANNRFLDTLGKFKEDVIGKHHKDITSMDINADDYNIFWQDLLQGKTKRFIESFNIQDNAIWLSQNYVPILDKNGQVFKILNIAIDISENKILERQLREQVREISKEARSVRREQRKVRKEREEFTNKKLEFETFEEIADQYIGHVEFSIDGKILYVNEIFASHLKYSAHALTSLNINDLIYNEDFETFKLAMEKTKTGASYSSSITFLNSAYKQTRLAYTIKPFINSQKKVTKIILITK